ncbi:hypothetical protein SAMN05216275_12820 [Streptosporangium canum]|uniref:Uncharacterized protein n=1 Tax=Streptosporangium canum TaxID=324952 RepID=A0A1I4ADV7_9ACTN|nr:hypothetical protein [Streptosporangium canum]SFK54612.1 hypothetical protein SAMN05216275_12820 [Streptosporangium canum]
MHIFIRNAGTALAGVVLAGAGLLVALPAHAAAAAHTTAPKAAPVAACTQTAQTRGWICFLRYCDAYYCYYDCYPTAESRRNGEQPAETIRVPKPAGEPPAQIDKP